MGERSVGGGRRNVRKIWRAGQPKVGALVRTRRRQMHMTLQTLSDASGVSVGYLSQIERDLAMPSLGTLAQIAQGLGAELNHFILAPAIDTGLSRAEGRMVFSVGGSPVSYERIGADFAGNQLSSFVITIPPGHRSEVFSHEGEELVYMLEGRYSSASTATTPRFPRAMACISAASSPTTGGTRRTLRCD